MVLAKLANVAGFVALVDGAAAVDDGWPVPVLGLPGGGFGFLPRGDGGTIGVAEDEESERAARPGPLEAPLHRAQPPDRAFGVLVAQGHDDGGLELQGGGSKTGAGTVNRVV